MNFFHFFFFLMCEIASFELVGPDIYLTQVSQGVGERGKSLPRAHCQANHTSVTVLNLA